VGNLLSISDADSTYTYTYDVLNRMKSENNAGTPDMLHVVLSYEYDNMGNVTRTSDNLGVSVVSDVRRPQPACQALVGRR
jgi:YD repeat-containing protein